MEKVNGRFKLPLFETLWGYIANFETLGLKLKNPPKLKRDKVKFSPINNNALHWIG
jgi:hypothetical protein